MSTDQVEGTEPVEQHALLSPTAGPDRVPVGSLQTVLAAVADPVRLEMVRRMATAPGEPVRCSLLYDSISKSTASHHFKILREAGVTERVNSGGTTYQLLRTGDVESAYPGVLSSILAASA